MTKTTPSEVGHTFIKSVDIEGAEVYVFVSMSNGQFLAKATTVAGAEVSSRGGSMDSVVDGVRKQLREKLVPIEITIFKLADRWSENSKLTPEDARIVGRNSRTNALLMRDSQGKAVKDGYGDNVSFWTARLTVQETAKLLALHEAKAKATKDYAEYKESLSYSGKAVDRMLAGEDPEKVAAEEKRALAKGRER